MNATRAMSGSDEALYLGFLETGDRQALNELILRWHGRAFRFARCLCLNSELAEEAVQDAFLILLRRTSAFRDCGPGSFRPWFLRVVANSAKMALRRERRALRRKRVDPKAYAACKRPHPGAAEAAAAPANGELLRGLERSLSAIGEEWRMPVVLHFIEGLQQREVASVLGVSQQTVSRRIEKGLGLLRVRLAQAGLACAAPALNALNELNELMDAPLAPPPAGFCERLLAHSERRALAKTSLALRGAGLGGLVAAVVLVAACVSQTEAQGTLGTLGTRDQGGASSGRAPEPALQAEACWDFNAGLPDDLTLRKGTWAWAPRGALNGSGALRAGPQETFVSLPDLRVPEAVLRLNIQFKGGAGERAFGVAPRWIHGPRAIDVQYFKPTESMLRINSPVAVEAYASARNGFVAVAVNGEPYFAITLRDRTKQLGPDCGFDLVLASAEADDLSVRVAGGETAEQWRRWTGGPTCCSAYKDFDGSRFCMTGTSRVAMRGAYTFEPKAGFGGGGTYHLFGRKGLPVVLASPSAGGPGLQVMRLRWRSSGTQPLRLADLHAFAEPDHGVLDVAEVPRFANQASRPPLAHAEALAQAGEALAPGAWHEIAFVLTREGVHAIADGQRRGFRADPRALDRATFCFLWAECDGFIDDYKVYLDRRPERDVLQALLSETRPASAAR